MSEHNHKILIVDDDSFLLDMYSLKFSQSGFTVETALGSEAALAKLGKGFVPDVMLLDLVMPVMNGFELLEKMQKENLAKHAVKIVLSNRGQQSDIDQANKFDIAGYIIKANSTPKEVIEQVTSLLAKHKK